MFIGRNRFEKIEKFQQKRENGVFSILPRHRVHLESLVKACLFPFEVEDDVD